MPFNPKEILFSLTSSCNLSCPHCESPIYKKEISVNYAKRFLINCKKTGIRRVGFTGGEPFLVPDLLCNFTKQAVKDGYLFDRVMTNGVWFKNTAHLETVLSNLFHAGYDGTICMSIDAFHAQSLIKIRGFIKAALRIWRRPDVISIACVRGVRDAESERKLNKLAALLKSRLIGFKFGRPCIKGDGLFIRIFNISLSPIGRAGLLKKPWGKMWFKEDYCKGPGDVFFVTPSGDVKPCCGYASDLEEFTIGNIKSDTPAVILKNFRKNRYLCAIFNSGLGKIRKKLEDEGVLFPGRTANHCYFCHYIFTEVPRPILTRCVN